MSTDTDTLRPEVRDALAIMDRDCPETIDWQRTAWGIIRAELLRLARELAAVRERVETHGFAGGPSLASCVDAMGGACRTRDTELTALRATLDGALLADVRRAPSGLGRIEIEGLPREWIGQRVRLVREDGDA